MDSQKDFAAPAMATCGSEKETLTTTPSYPSSSSETRSPPLLRSRSSSRSFTDLKRGGFSPPVFSSLVERKSDLEQSEVVIPSLMEKKSSFDGVEKQGIIGEDEVKPLMATPHSTPPPPPPPPPPPRAGYWESKIRRSLLSNPIQTESVNFTDSENVEKNEEISRPKLKPLHWDKVRASSDRAMVWDQLKSSSFQVNEEMIESLFICNGNNGKSKETTTAKQQILLPLPKQEKRVLDPKKSQNIAILLRALNVTKEEVCEALLEGNSENLGSELMETLLKMAPSKEEEDKLREYKGENSTAGMKLGPAEKFLMALIDIPFAFKRVDAMLYIINFDSEVNYLKDSFQTLEAACEELRSSRLFLKLLEAVLKTGNRMNVGTDRGGARSFKLDTLLKLSDVKGGADGKTTLLHFVLQEVTRSEGSLLLSSSATAAAAAAAGLQLVSNLSGELASVKKSASMDSDVLNSYVAKLAGEISKVKQAAALAGKDESCRKFAESMRGFLQKGEDEIIRVQAQQSVALSLVKEITEYFHGNSAREEAHPFRIFMVVRDFLNVLDGVCKEVGKMGDLTMVSAGRQFPVPVNPSLLPKLRALRPESEEEDGTPSPLSS